MRDVIVSPVLMGIDFDATGFKNREND